MVIPSPASDWFTILYKSYATSHSFAWLACVLNDGVLKRKGMSQRCGLLVPVPYTTISSRTRIHSSRMHTSHSLTVCQSLLPRGGVCFWGVSASGVGDVCSGGVCSQGGVCSGGCLLRGLGCLLWGVFALLVSAPGGCGIPACTEADPL